MSAQNSSDNSKRGRGRELEPFRWQKGQSGNPGGRPKRKPITDAYKQFLQSVDKDGYTAAQRIAQAMITRAVAGDVPAVKELTDRVEGSVRQALDILFGELTDEQLAEFVQAQFGSAGIGDAGGEETGAGPGEHDPVVDGGAAPSVDAAAGASNDGI